MGYHIVALLILVMFMTACDFARNPQALGRSYRQDAISRDDVSGIDSDFTFALSAVRPQMPLNDFLVERFIPQKGKDYVIRDQLGQYHQAQLYAFQAVEGQNITIHMRSESMDAFLVLLDGQGSVVSSNDDQNIEGSPYSLDASMTVTLPRTGLYFLLASSFEYIDTILSEPIVEQLPYRLSIVTHSEHTDIDILPQIYRAETLRGEQRVISEHKSEQSASYFFIDAEQGDRLNIQLRSDDFDTLLQLFAPNGHRIAVSDDAVDMGTDSSIHYIAPLTGRYFVMASDVFFYNQGLKDARLMQQGGAFSLDFQQEQGTLPEPY